MSDAPEDRADRNVTLVLVVVFLLVVTGGSIDLVLDRPTTLLSVHVIFELVVIGISLASAAYLARGWHRTELRLLDVERDAERIELEKQAWKEKAEDAIHGFADAIEAQLDSWSLTPAERRVAVMLLKGYSHKRIARRTETSERTARQHAVAVYRKAGLAGRAELAGFFLEALPDGGKDAARDAAGAAPAHPLRASSTLRPG